MVKQVTIMDKEGESLALAYCAELDGLGILCFQREDDAATYEKYLHNPKDFSPEQEGILQIAMQQSVDFFSAALEQCDVSQVNRLKQKIQHLNALIREPLDA